MIVDPYLGWVPQTTQWAPSIRYLMRRRRIIERCRRITPGRYLEVGCGAGTLLAEFGSRGFDAVGMETAAGAMDLAKEVIRESGQPIQLTGESQPAWLGRFDVVGAFDVLEHIEDDRAALQEWSSWLAPSGVMLLSVPAHPGRWGAGDVWAGHFRRYERTGLVGLVESLGLQVEHVECYGFPIANISEALGEFYYRRAIRSRDATSSGARAIGNALSGIERGPYRRAGPLLTSRFGRAAIMLADAVQSAAANTNWGSGYLLEARRA